MDLWMVSTIGFSDDDITAVKKVSGVESVMGTKFVDGAVEVNGEKVSDMGGSQTICRVYGVNLSKAKAFAQGTDDKDYINRITLTDGRYPENKGECLVDSNTLATPKEFVIGNTIKVSGVEENLDKQLGTTEFKIVGIIETPRYVSFERGQTTVGSGSLGCFIYVPDDAFSTKFYSELCVTIKDADKFDPYGDEYFESLKPITKNIESISSQCLPITSEQVIDYYSSQLKEAKEEYAKAEKEAQSKLGDAYSKLEENKKKLEQAESELSSAKTQAEAEFAKKYQELLSGESEYSAGLAEYNAKYDEYLAGKNKIAEGEKAVETYKAQLPDAQKKLDTLTKALEPIEQQINAYNSQINGISDNIAAKQAEIDAVTQQIAELENPSVPEGETASDNTAEIEQLRQQLDVLNSELATLTNEKNSIQSQLNQYKKDQNYSNLAFAKVTYATTVTTLNNEIKNAEAEIAQGKIDIANAEKALATAKAELESAGFQIEEGWDAYNSAYSQANSEYATNSASLEEARKEFEKYSSEYSSEKEKAYAQLDDARYDIEKAEEQVNAAVNNPKWYIYDRNALPGYEGYGQTAENMKAFASVFPLFFFVVAALVCLTTMTRMVDEERTQLGTLKALGYTQGSIRKKYIFYAFLASIIGSVIGLAAGLVIYPKAIFAAYGLMYDMPKLVILFPWEYMVSGTAFAVLSTLIVTYVACFKEMRSCPATLMRPRAPKAGKRVLLERIPFIWNSLNFTSKVTVRNIFRNKKRFLMTLIGITGCTALLVTGFGLSDSINAIIGAQYGEGGITQCDCQIAFKNSQTSVEASEIYNVLRNNENIEKTMMFYSKSIDGTKKGADEELSINLLVPQSNQLLSDFIDLKDRKTGHKYALTDNGGKEDCGVIVTEKFADKMGIKQGDYIDLKFSEELTVSIFVSAIVENYTYHYVYMSAARYADIFGVQPSYNYAYVQYTDAIRGIEDIAKRDATRAKISEELMKYNDINAVIDVVNVSETFGTMFASLDYVILVFIISAAALAFIVLYNLTNININERQREIATLKVLGFHNRESSSYIGRENMTITIMGMILGLIAGIYVHEFVIKMAEVNVVMFGREIELMSFVWSAVLTLVFSALVSIIMHFRIKKIHMVESLKSIE